MEIDELLYETLPDPLPAPRRGSGWGRLLEPGDPPETDVIRLVRRSQTQSIVRAAYAGVLAEQGTAHLGPAGFEEAWRARLSGMLDDSSTSRPDEWPHDEPITQDDRVFAWRLLDLAAESRRRTLKRATLSRPKRVRFRDGHVHLFECRVVSGRQDLGDVRFGICRRCQVGLLYKIEFPPDWQFCGFGTLALTHLERRYVFQWFTTGQSPWARGFYDRYRKSSCTTSPWVTNQTPCRHFSGAS